MSSQNWKRSIEQIALTNARHRVLGLTSARRKSGVSLMCRLIARTLASSGTKTLLVDMSAPNPTAADADGMPLTAGALRGCIVPTAYQFDLLSGVENEEQRAFANLPRLRELLLNDLSDYQHVVLDLPPMLESDIGVFNKLAAAALCDRLLLVCAIGKDKQAEITEVAGLLRGAGVALSGIISNERDRVDTWQEVAKLASWRPWR